MNKKPNTRRALVLSCLSLLLCISMLVGSTFAWFTDNATTGINTIQAGTLGITLEMSKDGENWEDAENKTLDFIKHDSATETDILWEPGAMYKLPALRITNTGNLHLKFKLNINGLTGADAILGNALLVGTMDASNNFVSMGTLAELAVDTDGAAYGTLAPKGQEGSVSSAYSLVVKMDENAGNEYQGKTLDSISVTVQATQAAVEYDSFNNSYDENADYADYEVTVTNRVNNQAALEAALESAKPGDGIALGSGEYTLTKDLEGTGTLVVENNENVTIKLENNSISAETSEEANAPAVLNNGNLTIEGGSITNNNATNANNKNVPAVQNTSGTLTLKNCTIKNTSPTSGGAYAVDVKGGTVVLENCTVEGNRGGIAVSGDGAVQMNSGSVTATVYYPLYIGGTGASSFNNVIFTKESSNKGKALTYNFFNENEGTATFTGCTFKSNLSATTKLDINNNTTGFTFNNCTYTNVTAPN